VFGERPVGAVHPTGNATVTTTTPGQASTRASPASAVVLTEWFVVVPLVALSERVPPTDAMGCGICRIGSIAYVKQDPEWIRICGTQGSIEKQLRVVHPHNQQTSVSDLAFAYYTAQPKWMPIRPTI